jgi:hypothetical protein
VDDADTVASGRLQISAGCQLARASPETLQTAFVIPVLGLGHRAELGAAFGYQWRRARRGGPWPRCE